MPLNLGVLPSPWLVPGVYVGVDGSGAVQGTPAARRPVLLLGMRRTTGEVAPAVLKPITGPTQGATYFGRGSQLAAMCARFVAANPYAEVFALALNENGAGASATSAVTITGTATEDATLSFVWCGRRRKVGVTKGQAFGVIAAAIKAADDLDTDSESSSTVALGVVTATARHKGLCGNDLSIFHNYFVGDRTPAGITVTVTAFAGGTANPDITTAIAALGGDAPYYTIVPGWTDSANVAVLETELTARWGPIRQLPGHAIAVFRATHTDSQTYGNARNSPFVTVLAPGETATSPWADAAALAAVEVAETDPARPRQNIKIPGMLPPLEVKRFNIGERNLLLMDGMATCKIEVGEVYIERLVTTYQTNGGGAEDPSYKDIEIMRCIAHYRAGWRSRILRKYPNAKLGNDGENFAPGQVVVTPKLIRGEALAFFDEQNLLAVVEDRKQFAAQLIVERDVNDPNSMNVFLPPNFVNQLRTMATLVAFKI